ncbi:MAG: hypothetical protein R6U89_00670 [Dehalococcoidia bacterium]
MLLKKKGKPDRIKLENVDLEEIDPFYRSLTWEKEFVSHPLHPPGRIQYVTGVRMDGHLVGISGVKRYYGIFDFGFTVVKSEFQKMGFNTELHSNLREHVKRNGHGFLMASTYLDNDSLVLKTNLKRGYKVVNLGTDGRYLLILPLNLRGRIVRWLLFFAFKANKLIPVFRTQPRTIMENIQYAEINPFYQSLTSEKQWVDHPLTPPGSLEFITGVKVDGHIAGIAGFHRRFKLFHLAFMIVRSEYQARGLSIVLHRRQVAYAKKIGLGYFLGSASPENTGAFNIWLRFGYRIVYRQNRRSCRLIYVLDWRGRVIRWLLPPVFAIHEVLFSPAKRYMESHFKGYPNAGTQ